MKSVKIHTLALITIFLTAAASAQNANLSQPSIDRVTVNDDNTVSIYWMASSKLNVASYNIYKLESPRSPALNYQLVGSVPRINNVSSFSWTSPSPIPRIDVEGQVFGVAEVYTDNSEGAFSVHHTVSLNRIDVDTCLFKATLHWTRYRYSYSDLTTQDFVHDGINKGTTYKVFWRKAGDPSFAQWSDEKLTDTIFTTPPLEPNVQYDFRINVIIPQRMVDAHSNIASINIASLTIPSYIHITQIEPQNNSLKLTIDIDKASQMKNYALLRSDSPTGTYVEIYAFDRIISSYTDDGLNIQNKYYYKIEAYKGCTDKLNIVRQSNITNNIYLETATVDQSPSLTWSTFDSPDVTYDITRTQPDNQTIVNQPNRSFLDNVTTLLHQGYDKYCYQVSGIDKDGNKSISNASCTLVIPNIIMPNAINPTSSLSNPNNNRRRNQFGPALDISDDNYSFRLEVYNRMKIRIFETSKAFNEPLSEKHFWDGAYQGKLVEPGSYMYTITVNFAHSQRQQKGSVSVIY